MRNSVSSSASHQKRGRRPSRESLYQDLCNEALVQNRKVNAGLINAGSCMSSLEQSEATSKEACIKELCMCWGRGLWEEPAGINEGKEGTKDPSWGAEKKTLSLL